MNEYQTRAAAALLTVAEGLPQTEKITYEAKGIVGGDFKVVVKRVSLAYSRGQQGYTVEVSK